MAKTGKLSRDGRYLKDHPELGSLLRYLLCFTTKNEHKNSEAQYELARHGGDDCSVWRRWGVHRFLDWQSGTDESSRLVGDMVDPVQLC
jgi:hypothetical protein